MQTNTARTPYVRAPRAAAAPETHPRSASASGYASRWCPSQ
jgi:hypothetical protein